MENLQDEKCAALLKYVLGKTGNYSIRHYSIIMNEGDPIGDDNLVLRKVDSGDWQIFNFERGKEKLYATFYSTHDAMCYFYLMLNQNTIRSPSPFSYIKEFEQETGIVW